MAPKNEKRKILSRVELKKHFLNGVIPSQEHFGILIDSVINQIDDGFRKEEDSGFIISPTGTSNELVSFQHDINSEKPFYSIQKDDKETESLRFTPYPENEDDDISKSIFLDVSGGLGIGTKIRENENLKLNVAGFAGMEGRVGTYEQRENYEEELLANGKWYSIIENLEYCKAFEIIARAGRVGSGKFSLLHAIVLFVYNKRSSKIKKVVSNYGFFWNKLNLRIRFDKKNKKYNLYIRTNTNYGTDGKIVCRITRLWDDVSFLNKDEYIKTSKKSFNQ